MSCDILCDHGHVPPHLPRNQIKRKRKEKKNQIKKNK